MSSICPWCNKRVYFAERQVKDGKDYHGICLRELLKGDKPKLIGVYPGEENRVAGTLNTHNKQPPAQQRAPSPPPRENPAPAPEPSEPAPSSSGKFCPSCGAARSPAAKFCPECGNKF